MRIRAWLWCAVLCLLLQAGIAVPPANLLPNGGFDQADAKGGPAGWTALASGGLTLALDRKDKCGGAASLRMSIRKVGGVQLTSTLFPVAADTTYLFTLRYRALDLGAKGSQGVTVTVRLVFSDVDDREIAPPTGVLAWGGHPWLLVLPNGDVPEWQRCATLVTPPAGAVQARVLLEIASTNDQLAPLLWLDELGVRPYAPGPAGATSYVYRPGARLATFTGTLVASADGLAATAIPEQHKAGLFVNGPNSKEVPCGRYRVTFRLKAASNASTQPLAMLCVNSEGVLGSRLARRIITGADFKAPDTYQEFSVDILRPPTGWLECPVFWSAATTLTLDRITVTEIQRLTPAEWDALTE